LAEILHDPHGTSVERLGAIEQIVGPIPETVQSFRQIGLPGARE